MCLATNKFVSAIILRERIRRFGKIFQSTQDFPALLRPSYAIFRPKQKEFPKNRRAAIASDRAMS
jgi:hypothetical protein